jgi:hypothetical protein
MVGDNFARARLLLAKRAGYLPNMPMLPGAGQASAMWRNVSKNLGANARGAGFTNPLQWLRAGAAAGGNLPRLGNFSGIGRPRNLPQFASGNRGVYDVGGNMVQVPPYTPPATPQQRRFFPGQFGIADDSGENPTGLPSSVMIQPAGPWHKPSPNQGQYDVGGRIINTPFNPQATGGPASALGLSPSVVAGLRNRFAKPNVDPRILALLHAFGQRPE